MEAVPTRSVTVRAPGRVSVFFRVGARHHDGHYEVASLSQAVSLYDDVTASPAAEISARFSGPIDTTTLPLDERNLAVKAAQLISTQTGYRGGVELRVKKRIPLSGGLGGGSADAAAVLVACDKLWGTQLGRAGRLALGAKLGSDVAFALEGGTAVGTGRGEELSPALAQGSFHWVLALSDRGHAHERVFEALARHRALHASALGAPPAAVSVDTAVLQAVRGGDPYGLAEAMHNDLQAAALKVTPALASLLEMGERAGALASIVSGSGPTVAFLTSSAKEAGELKSTLTNRGVQVLHVHGPVHGASVLGGHVSR